jgi:hypothetical protein
MLPGAHGRGSPAFELGQRARLSQHVCMISHRNLFRVIEIPEEMFNGMSITKKQLPEIGVSPALLLAQLNPLETNFVTDGWQHSQLAAFVDRL